MTEPGSPRVVSSGVDGNTVSTMGTAPRMVFLGFGKYVRADRIYALEPIVGVQPSELTLPTQ